MKRCSCCLKFKPESEFYKNKSMKDGLQNICRECHSLLMMGYKAKIIRENLDNMVSATATNDDYLFKGLKITVLNHPKKLEKTYNILNLNDGVFFASNDKEAFFCHLEKLLRRAG